MASACGQTRDYFVRSRPEKAGLIPGGFRALWRRLVPRIGAGEYEGHYSPRIFNRDGQQAIRKAFGQLPVTIDKEGRPERRRPAFTQDKFFARCASFTIKAMRRSNTWREKLLA